MMILLIDNFDSFVYNLAHYIMRVGEEVKVARNTALTVEEVREMRPQAIVLSPGPCAPDQAGICLDLVRELHAHCPILGICLGHQVIGQVMGGDVVRAIRPVHGKVETIYHSSTGIFRNINNPAVVTRYHSLIVKLRQEKHLKVTAKTQEGEIMAFEHKTCPTYGLQFHPEAFLTTQGYKMIGNFIDIVRRGKT